MLALGFQAALETTGIFLPFPAPKGRWWLSHCTASIGSIHHWVPGFKPCLIWTQPDELQGWRCLISAETNSWMEQMQWNRKRKHNTPMLAARGAQPRHQRCCWVKELIPLLSLCSGTWCGRRALLQDTVESSKERWASRDLYVAAALGPCPRAACNTALPALTPLPSKWTVYNSLLFIRVSIAAINISCPWSKGSFPAQRALLQHSSAWQHPGLRTELLAPKCGQSTPWLLGAGATMGSDSSGQPQSPSWPSTSSSWTVPSTDKRMLIWKPHVLLYKSPTWQLLRDKAGPWWAAHQLILTSLIFCTHPDIPRAKSPGEQRSEADVQ